MRLLGIPTVEARVVQQAVKFIIEPILETTCKDSSYGFRPKRSAHQAIKQASETRLVINRNAQDEEYRKAV